MFCQWLRQFGSLSAQVLVPVPVLLLVLVAGCSVDTPQDELANARAAIAEEKFNAATISLKNVLQKNNRSAEARWLLGKAYLATGDVLSAEKELRRALDLSWPQDDVLPALAQALVRQRKHQAALELDTFDLQPPAAAQVYASKAVAAISLGRVQQSQRLIEQALTQAPQNTDILLAKAKILGVQADYPAAAMVLEELLSRDAGNARVWALLGDLRMGQLRFNDAMEAFNKANALTPNDFGVLFKRALLALEMGKFNNAQRDARALLRRYPKHTGAHYVEGIVHFQAKRYEKATKSLTRAESAADEFPMVLFFLATALLAQDQIELAGVHAGRFQSLAPASIRGRLLYATTLLHQANYGEVQNLLGPVLDAAPDNVVALNLMANALLRDGQADEGLTLLSKIVALRPDSPLAQLRLGANLFMRGENAEAAQYMEAALALDPEFQQAEALLILNHLQKKEFERATAAAQAYSERNPGDVTALNLLGRVYVAAGEPEKAVATFEQVLQLEPANAASNHNLAQLALAAGDVRKARSFYEAVLAGGESNLTTQLQLARLDAKANDHAALERRLTIAIEKHPAALQPRILLGRYYLSQGRPEKVAALSASVDEMHRQNPQVLNLLARAQLTTQEHAAAQYTLAQLLEDEPASAALHHMLAVAAAGEGDVDLAESELRKALALDGDFVPARLAMAKLALDNNNPALLATQLARLKTLAPNNVDVKLLRAADARAQGELERALQFAQEAHAIRATQKTTLALGDMKEAAGDIDGSIALYQSWIAGHGEDVVVRMRAADTLRRANRMEEALPLYHDVLRIDARNTQALNVLAWHLRHSDSARALEYARRASDIAPRSAEVLHTLALVEYINKDYRRAARTVARALQQNTDNPSLKYHSAMIAVANGEKVLATSTLKALLRSHKDFPQIEKARRLLHEISE